MLIIPPASLSGKHEQVFTRVLIIGAKLLPYLHRPQQSQYQGYNPLLPPHSLCRPLLTIGKDAAHLQSQQHIGNLLSVNMT